MGKPMHDGLQEPCGKKGSYCATSVCNVDGLLNTAGMTLFAAPAYADCDPSEIGRDAPVVGDGTLLKGDDGLLYRCVGNVWIRP
jgi:hypothetical protein